MRSAVDDADLDAARALRALAFYGEAGRSDQDRFDGACTHILIEDLDSGVLVACFRLMLLGSGRDIDQSYSAQFYDLSRLRAFPGPVAELGRFCTHPDCSDPDILRLAWGAMTRYVDQGGIGLLFGCSSFAGTRAAPHSAAFSLLAARHLAPTRWRPGARSKDIVGFGETHGQAQGNNHHAALLAMPPLLRTYLAMGGWVSDHAVIDTDMNTLHVFTGLEIDAIPPVRKRLLRAVASE